LPGCSEWPVSHSSMPVSRDLPRNLHGSSGHPMVWKPEPVGFIGNVVGGRGWRVAGESAACGPEAGGPAAGGAPIEACRCPGICRGNVGGAPARGRSPAGARRPVLRATPVPKRGNAVPSCYGRVLKGRFWRGPGPLRGWPPGAAGCPGRADRRCGTHSSRPEASFRVLGQYRGPKNGS